MDCFESEKPECYNVSNAYFFYGVLKQPDHLKKLRSALNEISRHFYDVSRVLSVKYGIDLCDPNSALWPMATYMADVPSCLAVWMDKDRFDYHRDYLRNILISVSRKREHKDPTDIIDPVSADRRMAERFFSAESEVTDELPSESGILLDAFLESTASYKSHELEKAIRWNAYKINLGLVRKIDRETNVMIVTLDPIKPRREYEATSKQLQRYKCIPKILNLSSFEKVMANISENVLPDLKKVIAHTGPVRIVLPECFREGWPNLFKRPRIERGLPTEFVFFKMYEDTPVGF